MLVGVPPADEMQKGHRCRSPHLGNRLVITPRRNGLPGGTVCRSRSITPVGRPVSCPRLRREQWPTRTIRYRVERSRLAWTRNSSHEQRKAAFQHMLEPFVHREGTIALRHLSSQEGGWCTHAFRRTHCVSASTPWGTRRPAVGVATTRGSVPGGTTAFAQLPQQHP